MTKLNDLRESLIPISKYSDDTRTEKLIIKMKSKEFLLVSDDSCLKEIMSEIASLDDWDKYDCISSNNLESNISEMMISEQLTVLLDVTMLDMSQAIEYCLQVSSLFPNPTKILAIGSIDSLSLFRELESIGILYTTNNRDKFELLSCISSAFEGGVREKSSQSTMSKRAKQISVIGTKGSVGVSTITCALAYQLAHKAAKVLITDYQQLTSDLDIILNLNKFERFEIDNDFVHEEVSDINDIIFKYSDSLSVLALKNSPNSQRNVLDFQLNSNVIDKIKSQYNFIVADVPVHVVNTSDFNKIVETSNIFLVVVEPTVSSIRNARLIHKIVKGVNDKAKIIFCMSYTKKKIDSLLSLKETQKYLGFDIELDIPYKKNIRSKILGGVFFSSKSDMKVYSDLSNRITGSLPKKRKLFSSF